MCAKHAAAAEDERNLRSVASHLANVSRPAATAKYPVTRRVLTSTAEADIAQFLPGVCDDSAMRFLRIAAVAAATALAVAVPASASAAGSGHWHSVQVQVPAGGSYGQLDTIACRTASSCIAGGTFESAAKAILPLIAVESSGHWATGTALRLPADAAPDGSTAAVATIACPASKSCVAVGDYNIGSNILQGFIATGHGSSWGRAKQAGLPKDAVAGDAFLTGVSCPNTRSCTVVGGYTNSAGDQAMAETESAGHWQPAVAIRLPSNADANPAAHLATVSCTGPGDCVAIGSYTTKALDGEAMVATQRHGSWGRAAQMQLPRNAAAEAQAEISSISCVSSGSCVAVGSYATSGGVFAAVAATESGGHWRRAVELSDLPGNGAHNAASGLGGVSCIKSGCAAVGVYTDKHSGLLMMAMTMTGHTWHRGVQVALPPHAITGQGIQVGLSGVACTSGLSCTAVGEYTVTSPVLDALAARN